MFCAPQILQKSTCFNHHTTPFAPFEQQRLGYTPFSNTPILVQQQHMEQLHKFVSASKKLFCV
jgi:hypothetical protein